MLCEKGQLLQPSQLETTQSPGHALLSLHERVSTVDGQGCPPAATSCRIVRVLPLVPIDDPQEAEHEAQIDHVDAAQSCGHESLLQTRASSSCEAEHGLPLPAEGLTIARARF